ncbi:Pre-rRNA-processing protein esf2 [Sarcoptes scabiei]|uniref:Activator of basal transcription 1 n=1 Tax=Sarcoptes scabiei TaxID=52283 RepID=A0A132A4V9_SARSC|nr:Pre-rRNA-processing protein esf2 [Sarcoptes scabiei]KPM05987.1 pre-rRNA-processing protein ESF2-like protein [Sarcoptes scabiei]
MEELDPSNDTDSPQNEPCETSTSTKKSKKILDVTKPKSCKRGIVYLNFIPEGITVKNIRMILSKYGVIDRIYLEKDKSLRKNRRVRYTEGWIEFRKKSIAKYVAETLNGKPIGGRKSARYHDSLWNLKYLKRFKWTHLAEQMAYEKALQDQKLRLEIGRARHEASFYAEMIERNRHKKEIYNTDMNSDTNRNYLQRPTESDLKKSSNNHVELDSELLESIFK